MNTVRGLENLGHDTQTDLFILAEAAILIYAYIWLYLKTMHMLATDCPGMKEVFDAFYRPWFKNLSDPMVLIVTVTTNLVYNWVEIQSSVTDYIDLMNKGFYYPAGEIEGYFFGLVFGSPLEKLPDMSQSPNHQIY